MICRITEMALGNAREADWSAAPVVTWSRPHSGPTIALTAMKKKDEEKYERKIWG
jgi:hypothetical protein